MSGSFCGKKLNKSAGVKAAALFLSLACFFALPFFGMRLSAIAADSVGVKIATVDEIEAVANGIVGWKKLDVGSDPDGFLINDAFLQLAGTTPGDWYPIGMSRLGIADNYDGYLAVIADEIDKRYATPAKLDKAKATEWHRIALAVLASGGNPRKAGTNGDIDLIADGTFNRADENGGLLGKQGINGYIWGLIALDSVYYSVPTDSFYTRDDVILSILSREIDGGGWALSGSVPDPDITAMAIQALAPYYNSEKEYSVGGLAGVTKVRDSVKRALDVLSDLQQPDGDFVSWGTANSESTVQVLCALCSLGKNPFADGDFIKNGRTLYDGVMKYRNADGGFLHSYVYDEDNPSSLPDRSNTMAGEQALYGTAALVRLLEGKRRLYDFRAEQTDETKTAISEVSERIDALSYDSDKDEIERVYGLYTAIDPSERSYVYNYEYLSDLLKFRGIPYEEEAIDYNNGDGGDNGPMCDFTAADKARADALPQRLTMADRAEVLALYAKIRSSFEFDEKTRYYAKIEKAKNEIDALAAEIDDIKKLIASELYPFDEIGLGDKKTVYELYERFTALSEYDRSLFEKAEVETLVKSKTQVDNLQTAVIISVVLIVLAAAKITYAVVRFKKRKKAKLAKKMPESEE